MGRRLGGLLLLVGSVALAAPPWSTGPSLNVGRAGHTATLMRDGRVLVVGGYSPANSSAEVFDPALNTWTPVNSMSAVRFDHDAVTLLDGRVLVCGGWSMTETNSCLTWDPMNQWQAVAPMNAIRSMHTLTLLADGTVLAAGGVNASTTVPTAERYDPLLNQWTPTPVMGSARSSHRALAMPDGRVLAIGGHDGGRVTAHVSAYDPVGNVWGTMPSLNTARAYADALVLGDGTAFIVGGGGVSGSLGNGERFLPGGWVPTLPMSTDHYASTSTLLADGGVLTVAGIATSHHAICEVWTGATNAWTLTGSLETARFNHRAVRLLDGRVMVIGGQINGSTAITSTELYGVAVLVPDAGVADAGVRDAGSADGGTTPDGGASDGGGSSDGGTSDGGSISDGGPMGADAGFEPRTLTVGCGCASGAGSGWLVSLLGLLTLRRRARPTTAGSTGRSDPARIASPAA